MNSLGCIIYCHANAPLDNLIERLVKLTGSKRVSLSFIENETYEIAVMKNDDANSKRAVGFPEGFLHFRFKIEVGFLVEITEKEIVVIIGNILRWLWNNNMPAVAACDYEEFLPYKGGYKSVLIPWPKA